jgi:hypothetical protein
MARDLVVGRPILSEKLNRELSRDQGCTGESVMPELGFWNAPIDCFQDKRKKAKESGRILRLWGNGLGLW